MPKFEVAAAFTCALTFFCKRGSEAKTDETSNIVKITVTRIFLGMPIYPLISLNQKFLVKRLMLATENCMSAVSL